MNPFGIILIAGAGVLAYNLLSTARTALKLDYRILKFQIYNFASGGNIVFRCRIRFVNNENTALHIKKVSFAAYYNAKFTESDGKITSVSSRGTRIASCDDTSEFVIPALSNIEKDFYIESKWSNLLSIVGLSVFNYLVNDENLIDNLIGKPILIDGAIRAEGVTVSFKNSISISQ